MNIKEGGRRMADPQFYSKNGWNPKGVPRDKARCVKEVWADWSSHQCNRKRGYGNKEKYCKQHAKMRGDI